MKKLFLIFTGILLLTPIVALAGAEGHGGMGIYGNDKKLYLVDFYEAGIQSNPKFDTAIPTRPDYLTRVSNALSSVFQSGSPELNMIAQKLSEIANVSNMTSESLLTGMESYSWSLIDKQTVNPKDDHTPIVHKPDDIVPLALRRQRSIIFNPNFLLLSASNRVGTVFHEIAFAFVPPQNGTQNSDRAKEFNGMIFSQTISQKVGLLKSFTDSLQLPIGSLVTVNYGVTQEASYSKRIGFGPSVMWWWGELDNCNAQIDPDCLGGVHRYKYVLGDGKDPVGDYCGSIDYGGSIHTNLYVVSSILEIGFRSYADTAGNQMDYMAADITPDYLQARDGEEYAVVHTAGTEDCTAKIKSVLDTQTVKNFFAMFKAY